MTLQLLYDIYGFRAMFSPEWIVIVLLITTTYFLMVGPFRNRWEGSSPVSTKQKIFFAIGMFLLYAGFGGPLNLLGHFSFTAHMFQQSVLYMMMPPMIYLGLPEWFFRRYAKIAILRKVMKIFARPVVGLLMFNGLFSLYHYPAIFNTVMTDIYLHHLYHFVLVFAAFCIWWPIIGPIEEWRPLSGLKKMGYIFAGGALLTPACALIIFAGSPVYAIYTEGVKDLCLPFFFMSLDTPQLLQNWLSPLHDQQLGGIMMKIVQEIAYITALYRTFRVWYDQEKADDTLPSLKHQLG